MKFNKGNHVRIVDTELTRSYDIAGLIGWISGTESRAIVHTYLVRIPAKDRSYRLGESDIASILRFGVGDRVRLTNPGVLEGTGREWASGTVIEVDPPDTELPYKVLVEDLSISTWASEADVLPDLSDPENGVDTVDNTSRGPEFRPGEWVLYLGSDSPEAVQTRVREVAPHGGSFRYRVWDETSEYKPVWVDEAKLQRWPVINVSGSGTADNPFRVGLSSAPVDVAESESQSADAVIVALLSVLRSVKDQGCAVRPVKAVLYTHVLEVIAAGAADPVGLARLALEAEKI
jgi:hypothetical protein